MISKHTDLMDIIHLTRQPWCNAMLLIICQLCPVDDTKGAFGLQIGKSLQILCVNTTLTSALGSNVGINSKECTRTKENTEQIPK